MAATVGAGVGIGNLIWAHREPAPIVSAGTGRSAGVAPSIFTRWKAGKTEPNMEAYRRIGDAALVPKRPSRAAVLPDLPAPAEAAE